MANPLPALAPVEVEARQAELMPYRHTWPQPSVPQGEPPPPPVPRAVCLSAFRPCEGCVRRKAVCNVLLSGRSGACTRCRALKRRCDVKDDAKLFVASGRQQGAEKAKLGVSTLEDVRSLGLDRSQELVLAHVTQCRQDLLELGLRMDERMGAIESRLDDMVGTQSDGEPEGAGGTDGGVSVSPGLDSEGSEIGCDRVSDYDGESEDDGGDDRVKREGDYGKLGRDYRLRESDRYDPESDYVGGEGDKVSDSEESLCDGGR